MLEEVFQTEIYLTLFQELRKETLSKNEDGDKKIKTQTKIHLFETLTCMVNAMESKGVNDKMLNFLMSLVISDDPSKPFLCTYTDP